jgi:hypothetical protein
MKEEKKEERRWGGTRRGRNNYHTPLLFLFTILNI